MFKILIKMFLNSYGSVLCLTNEGITNFASLSDFDKKNIENFPTICKSSILAIEEDASNSIADESSFAGANISSISVSRLVTAANTAKDHRSIDRVINPQNTGHESVLTTFKIEHEVCLSIRDDCDS